MRPYEEFYWNPTESDSDESTNKDYHPISKEPYIDPWDLENYAYIREHLESTELSSSSSVPPISGSGGGYGGSAGEFSDRNSSLYRSMAPGGGSGNRRRFSEMRGVRGGYVDMSGDYADIDEVQYVSRRLNNNIRRQSYAFDYDIDENPYEEHIKNNPVFGIYDQHGRFRKVTVPISVNIPYKHHRNSTNNSMSTYGEYVDYDPYTSKHEIYSKLDEMSQQHLNRPMPIYDDVRRIRRKPNNFGLTNYGHLKIDYSLNWNDLNNYIRYNS